MGLKEEILALADRPAEEVEVPEWGGLKVRIMAMSAADRDAVEVERLAEKKVGRQDANLRAKMVARCLVDDKGERVFEDADIQALGKKSGKALDRLFWVAVRVNALSADEVKELEGNSGGAQPAG